jgi:hypothetical protein
MIPTGSACLKLHHTLSWVSLLERFMVAPITGPFSSSKTIKGPPTSGGYFPDWIARSRTWKRQKKPYNLPLDFTASDIRVTQYVSLNTNRYKEWWQTAAYVEGSARAASLKANAFNQAYSRLINGVQKNDDGSPLDSRDCGLRADTAQLGAALGERQKSLEMIASRSTQLLKLFKSVAKLDYQGAKRVLGKTYSKNPVKGVKGHAKTWADALLEYSFGWAPMVSDIGSAVDVLQNGVPPALIRGRGKNTASGIVHDNTIGKTTVWSAAYRVQLMCKVRVNNPNLFLANQLGLVNLASVAWELVPFSFVVDYFVNVNQFLEQFTDFWGVDVIEPFETDKFLSESKESRQSPTDPFEMWAGRYEAISRVVGPFPGPTLRVKKPWKLSSKRAATSVALLLQFLKH